MFKREGFYQFLHCNLRYVLQYILFKKFFLKEVYKNKIYMIQLSNSFKFFRKQKYEECVCVREREREREREKPLINVNHIAAAIIFHSRVFEDSAS